MRTEIRPRIVPATQTLLVALALLASGCASHSFVRNEDEILDSAVHQELDQIGGGVERVESQVAQLETTVAEQGERTEAVSRTAQEALDRATRDTT